VPREPRNGEWKLNTPPSIPLGLKYSDYRPMYW